MALALPSVAASSATSARRFERAACVARCAPPCSLGWLAHGLALAIDIAGIGAALPGARFGFAPVLSLTVWLVLAVYGSRAACCLRPRLRRVLAAVGAVVVLLVLAFPGESIAQADSPWMPLHWMLGIASYGLFGVAVLHGLLLDGAERQMRLNRSRRRRRALGVPLLRLERLTFRFVDAGFVVLSCGARARRGVRRAVALGPQDGVLALGWATFAGRSSAGAPLSGWRGRRATRWLVRRGRRCCCWPTSGRASCSRWCTDAAMKYLVLLIVVGLVLWLMFGRAGLAPVERPERRGNAQPMVRCAHCGVHLPRSEALLLGEAAFCSQRAPDAGARAVRLRETAAGRSRRRPSSVGRVAALERSAVADVRRVWFAALGVGPSDRQLGPADESRFAAGWPQQTGNDDTSLTRQARRIASQGAHTFQRIYRVFVGARAALGLALVVAHAVGSLAGGGRSADDPAGQPGLRRAGPGPVAAAAASSPLAARDRSAVAPAVAGARSASTWSCFSGSAPAGSAPSFNYVALLVLPVLMAGVLMPRRHALATAVGRDHHAVGHGMALAPARAATSRCR